MKRKADKSLFDNFPQFCFASFKHFMGVRTPPPCLSSPPFSEATQSSAPGRALNTASGSRRRVKWTTDGWEHKFLHSPSRKNAALACVSAAHISSSLFKPEKILPPISKCGCCIVLKPDLPPLSSFGRGLEEKGSRFNIGSSRIYRIRRHRRHRRCLGGLRWQNGDG